MDTNILNPRLHDGDERTCLTPAKKGRTFIFVNLPAPALLMAIRHGEQLVRHGACHWAGVSQNSRMSGPKRSGKFQCISGLLLLLLTACPTPPKKVERVTPLEQAVAEAALSAPIIVPGSLLDSAAPEEPINEPAQVESAPEISIITPPEIAAPAPIVKVEPIPEGKRAAEDAHDEHSDTVEVIVPPPQQNQNYFVGLIPVQDWVKAQPSPFTFKQANREVFQMETSHGQILFTLGSRFAKWNGVALGLGFPPSYKQGKLCLHSLDLQKNLMPLLAPPSLQENVIRTVLIDPGHGGSNYGAKSLGSKFYEKDFTLDWALRIQKAMAGSNWKVVLTRTNDSHVELMDRVALADAIQADLFISLHFNSAPVSSKKGGESGLETYCLTPTGLPSNIVREFHDDPHKVFPNNLYDAENVMYAARIQQNLIQLTGRKDRGVRRARFMTVLREQKRPAVLIEGGFLSNPTEAGLIGDPAYRQQLALAVRNSLLKMN
ncbi:MAG: N-acetylmuramoyl-L-alanine amidase [Verrucomicrobiales bacterium]